jgi:hypothetical protein
MKIEKLSKQKMEELSEAFSRSPVMAERNRRAEEVFNSPQFLEFLERREAIKNGQGQIKKGLNGL